MRTYVYFIRHVKDGPWSLVERIHWVRMRRHFTRLVVLGDGGQFSGMAFAKVEDRPW